MRKIFITVVFLTFFACIVVAEVKQAASKPSTGNNTIKTSTQVAPSKPEIDKRTNVQKLQDPDWRVRRNAAIIIGAQKDKKAVGALIKLLNDENIEVRRAAAVALGEINDPQAVNPLIKFLNDPDGGMIIECANALGKIKDPKSISGLVNLMNDGRSVVRITALRSLSVFASSKTVANLIVNAIGDEAEGVRIIAIQQTVSLNLKVGVPNLLKALSDVNQMVRVEAAKALGELGDISVIGKLKAALENKENTPEVSDAIKQAIDKIESSKSKK